MEREVDFAFAFSNLLNLTEQEPKIMGTDAISSKTQDALNALEGYAASVEYWQTKAPGFLKGGIYAKAGALPTFTWTRAVLEGTKAPE